MWRDPATCVRQNWTLQPFCLTNLATILGPVFVASTKTIHKKNDITLCNSNKIYQSGSQSYVTPTVWSIRFIKLQLINKDSQDSIDRLVVFAALQLKFELITVMIPSLFQLSFTSHAMYVNFICIWFLHLWELRLSDLGQQYTKASRDIKRLHLIRSVLSVFGSPEGHL